MLHELATYSTSPSAICDNQPPDFAAAGAWRVEDGSQQGGAGPRIAFSHAESGSPCQVPRDGLVERRVVEHRAEQWFGFGRQIK